MILPSVLACVPTMWRLSLKTETQVLCLHVYSSIVADVYNQPFFYISMVVQGAGVLLASSQLPCLD